ncbi:MAG TPA: hypothetical protein VE961_12750 [Pyrinomonadaceae bacterium]|nr:hypothetical protein [Pyrinomonadaceae bacterium]
MAQLTEQEFSRHLNSRFYVKFSDGDLPLDLVEVTAYRPQEHEEKGMERFSAVFSCPANLLLPQGLYHLSHEQMGELDIFLVPVTPNQRGPQYEAVFNYYRD